MASPDRTAIPSRAAVVPTRDLGLLDGCLDALLTQESPLDEVVIVDDTAEGSLTLDRPGVTVLRSGGRGPYAARNVGWKHTSADIVLFLDSRSRPLPHWSVALAATFDADGVALAGSDVEVRHGTSVAACAIQRLQPFRTEQYVNRPYFRPYFPTCNLAVRRSELVRVGGFKEIRSGGDADLCWRILGDRDRQFAVVSEVLMEWVPRNRLIDLLEQYYRYGRSEHALRAMWEDDGAPQRPPLRARRLASQLAMLTSKLAAALALRRHDDAVRLVTRATWYASEFGYASAARQDG